MIDPTAQTLYVVVKTKEPGPPYFNRIHAIDITTGEDRVTPVAVAGTSGKQHWTTLIIFNGPLFFC